jgi:hypothetical protein
MESKMETWTKKRAGKRLEALLGQARAIWVSCYKDTSRLYQASVWEEVFPGPPIHLGYGRSGSRSEAIRLAVEDVLNRLQYAVQENAEQLVETWVNGNRRHVLGRLQKMPGSVAAAAALTIAQALPERERQRFVSAVLLAAAAMAPEPELPGPELPKAEPTVLRKRAEPLLVEDHCPECEEPESECVCDEHDVCPVARS